MDTQVEQGVLPRIDLDDLHWVCDWPDLARWMGAHHKIGLFAGLDQ
jgi:hypothetical protein